MPRIPFPEPVAVWLFNGQPDLGMRLIRDVHDGLAALHRYGIENLKNDGCPCREWRVARSALDEALREPTLENVSAARTALIDAAARVGALAATDGHGIFIMRREPFAT
ncbi:hypothetical protein [Enterovirga aerilata]|uniref:Uncharacterized protein n=1 Tax=Enterovirga aerilata TaxID=2730920 RepID=A0A849IAV2_9HYPH|nr:hypothetical protein [Enterovirga sp. DB1703]NNM73539.1 hypothetical protein [Enterovirga sp. DB1703]